MGEIVNLRQARKQRDRQEKQDRAGENRIVYGRTKAEKHKTRAEKKLADDKLEGHRRDPGKE